MLNIGVTGTNGKSTTCNWIEAAIGSSGNPVASIRNTGCVLAGRHIEIEPTYAGFCEFQLLAVQSGAVALIVEVTSLALAGGFADAWSCDVAVITNITHDHLNVHGTMDAYIQAKGRLFDALVPNGIALVNGNDLASARLVAGMRPDIAKHVYGMAEREAVIPLSTRATLESMSWSSTRLSVSARSTASPSGVLMVPAPGQHFAENALAAWTAATSVGISAQTAAAAITAAHLPAGRFDIVSREPTVIVDYAHSPDALQRTLATVRRLAPGRVTVVFGAGGNTDKTKRAPMGTAAAQADVIILTSDDSRDEDPMTIATEIQAGIPGQNIVRTILDRREAIVAALSHVQPGDAILITGRGPEQHQLIGSKQLPFFDRGVVLEVLAARASHS